MKWMFGKTAMWTLATLAVATVAFAATQDVPLPDGDGKKILTSACTACHGLDGVGERELFTRHARDEAAAANLTTRLEPAIDPSQLAPWRDVGLARRHHGRSG